MLENWAAAKLKNAKAKYTPYPTLSRQGAGGI
jgi:hypothetical protein